MRKYQQYYVKKNRKLRWYNFLQRHKLLKLTQEETENLNRPRSREIKLVIKSTKQISGPGILWILSNM